MSRLAALLLAFALLPAASAAAEDGGMAVPDSDAGAVTAPAAEPPPAAVEPEATPAPVEPEPVPEIDGPYGPNHVAAVEEVGSAVQPAVSSPPAVAVATPDDAAPVEIQARPDSGAPARRRVDHTPVGASGPDLRPAADRSAGPPWLLFAALAGALLALMTGFAARRAHVLHKFA